MYYVFSDINQQLSTVHSPCSTVVGDMYVHHVEAEGEGEVEVEGEGEGQGR